MPYQKLVPQTVDSQARPGVRKSYQLKNLLSHVNQVMLQKFFDDVEFFEFILADPFGSGFVSGVGDNVETVDAVDV